MLARLREQEKLGQSSFGQIDATSETIKLATLGMRNIAANILWSQALTQQKKQEWTALSATLEQITKVQPNFLKVWEHQAWNLSYNVSAEFDDYRGRYFWVMKGIRFLQDGIAHNETSPRLVSSLGWFISQKIGTADEKVQYRRLFREDNDFHGSRPFDQRDNWLVGRQYYLEAERVAERENAVDALNISPVVFYSRAPKGRINYATALEEDGTFEERAALAWTTAHHDWLDFGNRDIYKGPDRTVRLADRDPLLRRIEELTTQFDALPPAGRREQIHQEKLAALPKAEREAYERPLEQRSENDHATWCRPSRNCASRWPNWPHAWPPSSATKPPGSIAKSRNCRASSTASSAIAKLRIIRSGCCAAKSKSNPMRSRHAS